MRFANRMMFLLPALSLLATAGSIANGEGQKTKKFLTKPLVIEDQGSFFIGGVLGFLRAGIWNCTYIWPIVIWLGALAWLGGGTVA